MRSIRRVFSGCILLLLIEKYLHRSGSACRNIVHGDEIFWNCSGEYETTILYELDPKTNILDFSYTILEELNKEQTSRYTHLHTLYLIKTKIYRIEETSFLHLPNLTHLDLSGAKWPSHIVLRWPPKLKVLKLNFAFRKYIDVSDNAFLEELHAAHNSFAQIPVINSDAPLIYLDLDFNLQMNLTAEQLAPYCFLKYLGFASDALQNYCQCVRLHEWMNKFKIRTNYVECAWNKSPKPKCDLTFSSEVLYQRAQCLRKSKYSFVYVLLVVGCGFILFLAVITVGSILIRKKMGPEDVEKKSEDDKKKLTGVKKNTEK